MNILAVVTDTAWIQNHILSTMEKHYCENLYTFLCPGIGLSWSTEWRKQRDQLNHQLIQYVRQLKSAGKLDLIFCNIYDDFLLVDTVKQLRRENVVMVNYNVDMVGQWYRIIRTAPYFDAILAAHQDNIREVQKYCENVIFMPMAANPEICYKKVEPKHTYLHEVSFVGSQMEFRQAVFLELLSQQIPVTIYGGYWKGGEPQRSGMSAYKFVYDLWFYALPRYRRDGSESLLAPLRRRVSEHVPSLDPLPDSLLHGRISDEKLPEIFRDSRINLGFSDYGWSAIENLSKGKKFQVRLRDFEVPMAGGFYLAQLSPEHHLYYRIGEEIETWTTVDELVDKIKFYIGHADAAEKIRERGQQRALQDHTWQVRFDQLFKTLRDIGLRI